MYRSPGFGLGPASRPASAPVLLPAGLGVNAGGEKHLVAAGGGVRQSTRGWRPETGPWVSIGAGGDLAADTPAAMPDAQDIECAERTAEICPAEGQAGRHRGQCRKSLRSLHRDPWGRVSDGGHVPGEGPRRIDDVPRLPGCTPAKLQDGQSDRIHLCHRTRRPAGCPTRHGMLHMIFNPGLCARARWSRMRGLRKLERVMTGVKFKDRIAVIETAKPDHEPETIAA